MVCRGFQNQVPPKLQVPPYTKITEVPPLKPRVHVRGNQGPSRECDHSSLGNSNLCNVFCTAESREQSNIQDRKVMARSAKNFWNLLIQMAGNCLKFEQSNCVQRSAPNDYKIFGGPPTVGGSPHFSQKFLAPGKYMGSFACIPPNKWGGGPYHAC